ncbi:MAG: VTT domain-containing protein [Candidatus Absconditabacteria bacterium]
MIDFILHIDVHLQALVLQYGGRVYGILFIIIFIETGLVIMPFLPGDSLLFVAGSLAGAGMLKVEILLPLLIFAAIIGDNTNYFIGKYLGHHVTKLHIWGHQLVKPKHIKKTETFFEKYGTKAIIIARFVPIVRTCTPFVAGVGQMRYKTFFLYDCAGGILWISALTLLGYFFGQMPLIKNNFEKAIFAIIFISILPILFEYAKHLWVSRKK